MLRSHGPFSIFNAAIPTLLSGLVITVLLFIGVGQLEYDKTRLDFQQQADARITAIQRGLDDSVQLLAGLNQLFVTFDSVSREQFHTFSAPLLAHYSYIQAFNFHRMLSQAERPTYEAQLRQRFPGFSVTVLQNGRPVPSAIRPSYYIVDYIEPMQGNEAAFGLDVSPNPVITETLQRAVPTGLAESTALLRLAQGQGSHGFLVLMPVYRHGASLVDAAARQRAFLGDTAVVFRTEGLFRALLGSNGFLKDSARIDISIYSGDRADERNLAFRDGNEPPAIRPDTLLPVWLTFARTDAATYDFNAAGRPWHVVVSAASAPFLSSHIASVLTLVAGVLFSLLAALYLQRLALRSRHVQQLVETRTAELRQSNELLIEDIAERRRMAKLLEDREREFRHLAENSPDVIVRYDRTCHRVYANAAYTALVGMPLDKVLNKTPIQIFAFNDPVTYQLCLKRVLETGKADSIEISFGDAEKTLQIRLSPEFDGEGNVVSALAVGRDVTELLAYRQKIHSLAFYDVLTGLPNRALFNDRISQALAGARRDGLQVGVMMLDLDRFKTINDTLGHSAGDELLCETARRLVHCVRATDTVARLGGDEFIIVLPGIHDEMDLGHIAGNLLASLVVPVTLEGRELVVSASIGIALYPDDGEQAETLVKYADGALYDAKARGRNNFQFYSQDMTKRDSERLHLEADLRRGLVRGELQVHYQPKIDLGSGKIVGAEALLRWHHPERGWVAPDSFISIAEDTGLILAIGELVLRDACETACIWNKSGQKDWHIAVNLSPRQVQTSDIVATVRNVLSQTGCEPRWLELEMTEGLLLKDSDTTQVALEAIYAMGVNIAIDDFGTGYSALSYLTRFPIATLKIDSSFINNILRDPGSAVLVQSIIAMAHGMGMKVVAEGVEEPEQASWLTRAGCDMGQGYHWGKAVPASEFATR
ncbi:EAL domain-containing protein [Silvimonas sp.]|uniref:bifunctional diguanylate cyclase/phosphodiesterase n=1 Tax=Silvimonas sp. TaxID=2650811 RepID=UPI00284E40AB|nr:EAL domain-containing protein [Silvimonas sp.]MDR3428193.1 EAL domain-containing protein [Silvimonas sp.]